MAVNDGEEDLWERGEEIGGDSSEKEEIVDDAGSDSGTTDRKPCD